MKHLILLLLFLQLQCIDIQAQSAFPTYEQRPIWCLDYLSFGERIDSYTIEMLPDTIICGKNYNALKAFNFPVHNTGRKINYIIGYLRQEGQKVYKYDKNCEELLQYDFSLQVGDTMHHSPRFANAVVIDVQYGQIGSKIRKVLYLKYLDNSLFGRFVFWVEGIGEYYPIPDLQCYSGVICEYQTNVICISTIEEVLAGTCEQSCDRSTSTSNNIKISEPITIFPNPISANAQLQIHYKGLKFGYLCITNSLGQIVHTENSPKNISGDILNLNWIPKTPGLYWITIATENGKRQTLKLIVQ